MRSWLILPLVASLGIFAQALFVDPPTQAVKAFEVVEQLVEEQHVLPRYVEAYYSPLGRSPVVDAVLGDPFYLPVYAQIVSEKIKATAPSNSLYQMTTACFMAGGMPLATELKFTPSLSSHALPESFLQAFGAQLGGQIYALWQAFIQISQEAKTVLAVLTPAEKEWLRQNYRAFFFGSQESETFDFMTTDSVMPLKFFTLAARVDLIKLADCARKLALIVDEVYQRRAAFSALQLPQDFIWEEQGLKCLITGRHHTTYAESADFFLALGGDNTFTNNAGGTEGTRPAALHISVGGHNQYRGKNFVQGSGFLGVGVLADFGGNSTFQAESYAQGAGFFGVGLLMNLGKNNRYAIDFFGQSCATFGASLMWNKAGHNRYSASESMAQAASSTLGIAFLVDDHGHNIYQAGSASNTGKADIHFCGIGQGGSTGVRYDPWNAHPSLYGGVSFLYNGGGHNEYIASCYAQGSAYFLGLGILVNVGGHNHFYAETDSQGQGLHLAAGLVFLEGGHNRFHGGWGSLGVGADRSVGMVINTGGHNSFQGTVQSLGSARKPKALGVFIDLQGNNVYAFKEESEANIQKPITPNAWPTALFLSIGPKNVYAEHVDDQQRGQNRHWGIGPHSVGLDVDVKAKDLPKLLFQNFPNQPRVDFPFDPLHGWANNRAYTPLKTPSKQVEAEQLVQQILKADYDQRRQLYESLDLFRFTHPDSKVELAPLLANPAAAPEDQFNYAALWAIQDETTTHLDRVMEALKQGSMASSYAREMAIKLIGTLAKEQAASVLADLMITDPTEENRAVATYYLAQIHTPAALALLKPAFNSPSEQVRYAAALGLQDSALPQALAFIVPLFEDPSFYVRRAAAMTAISLGDKEGIDVLLDTLKYDTLDTTDNYGDNLYSHLAEYVGVNFGLDKQAWLDWWQAAKGTFVFPAHKKGTIGT